MVKDKFPIVSELYYIIEIIYFLHFSDIGLKPISDIFNNNIYYHNHDNRYYKESKLDAKYIHTGKLHQLF